VENPIDRRNLLQRAKKLKDRSDTRNKIYIVPDLTKEQQAEDKILRDKLKALKSDGDVNLKIQKGDIVKYVQGVKTIVFKGDQ